ncbi:nucleoporin [Russula earlei]|uniref:Nucleoporin n=1 Tax=Russula earlei TaxID=71964 RepID=A0ACC0UM70_9AGAM|nr:nucleoporin [Russula earlei]
MQIQATPSIPELPLLQGASQVLQDYFAKDSQVIPDIGELLALPGIPSSASYSVSPDDYRVPFQKRRLIAIPEGLFQFYNTTDVISHMGLLSEIQRVWVAIDHKLFLWDYVEGQDLSSFVDQPDVITHVAIVNPKLGVFVDEINYLLILCTPLTVILLGVSATDVLGPNHTIRKEIKLFDLDMSVPCDVEMISIAGTADGRIFMVGSQDGHLYELHYQEKEGWFDRRVQLINHSVGGVQSFLPRFTTPRAEDRIVSVVSDPSRNLFYTLTANSTISVYYATSNKSVQISQTIQNLYKLAQEKAPGSPAITPKHFHVISLHVITQEETRSGLQLMAMTMNGVRLYFSASASPYGYYPASDARVQRPLQLIHLRLPPTNLLHPDEQSNPYFSGGAGYSSRHPQAPPTSRPFVLSELENSAYAAGLTIAAHPGDTDGTDFLLCMSPDLTRIGALGQTPQQTSQPTGAPFASQRPPLTERAALLTIPGRTWGMAALPRPKNAVTLTSPDSNTPIPIVTNELAYQFLEPPRQFLILTNVGITVLAKRRALDWLRDAIEEVHAEGNVQPIIDFRDSFGRDQTCAMLLALASGNAFLEFGEQSISGSITSLAPELINVVKQAFYDCGERPMWAERMTYGTGDGSGTALFSGRREGFALYFARLIRPIWKNKLIKPAASGPQSNIPEDILLMVQSNLFALHSFLEGNPHLFHSATGDFSGARAAPASDQEAWKAEQKSVAELQALLARTIEGVSFFLLLIDHRIGELIGQTDATIQRLMTSMTFEELIIGQNGVAASRALVNVIIDQQIGQQIAVDTISDILQTRCGSFCSTDDVMLYKAKESVRRAVESRNPQERQNYLGESLRLFMKGARIMEFDKLREVIGDYQQLDFAKGAIELPLYCAEALDFDGLGKEYWLMVPLSESSKPFDGQGGSNNVPDDSRRRAWERRARCYDLVLDSLEASENKATSGDGAAERVRSHAYELAFASADEIFHARLYEWVISRGLADELLEMRPPYLQAYLQREPRTLDKYQLLWQFYVKDVQPLRAAEVLATLAESYEFSLSLAQRIEYLTLAVGNAKSHPVSAGGKHESAIAFLTDLEEKLEVSQVQLEIFHALSPRLQSQPSDPDLKEKLELLERGLFSITELYQVYAEPYDLLAIKLLVLHVSQHQDEALVKDIWDRLFHETVHGVPPAEALDLIQRKVVPLGQRFHGSESSFPFKHITRLLVEFQLANTDVVPPGWVVRVLARCGVPYVEIWDVFHQMYESQVPPFSSQSAVQTLSAAICVLFQDWLEAEKQSPGEYFPADRIDSAVDVYHRELEAGDAQRSTREGYEKVRRELRRFW